MKIVEPLRQKHNDWQLQFINIVFLLLLFFVMNGTVANIEQPSIELPRSQKIAAGGTVSEAAYVAADNTLTFHGTPATAAAIAKAWLVDAKPERKLAPFQIVVDRRLPAILLMDRLQELKAAGLDKLSIVTLHETGDAQ